MTLGLKMYYCLVLLRFQRFGNGKIQVKRPPVELTDFRRYVCTECREVSSFEKWDSGAAAAGKRTEDY